MTIDFNRVNITQLEVSLMDDFCEEKEKDAIYILYEYDEENGKIISKGTREKLKKYYQKEEEESRKICELFLNPLKIII